MLISRKNIALPILCTNSAKAWSKILNVKINSNNFWNYQIAARWFSYQNIINHYDSRKKNHELIKSIMEKEAYAQLPIQTKFYKFFMDK